MKIKNTILLNLAMVLSATVCMAVGSASAQDIGYVDFASLPPNQNLGTTLNLFGGDVTVSARSSINPSLPYDQFAAGLSGTIYNVSDSKDPFKSGLGVQTLDESGSNGISGGGGHQEEELIFTYNNGGAIAGSIELQLNLLEFGSKAQSNGFANLDKSDPVLWINYDFGVSFAVDELSLYNAATPLGTLSTGTILGSSGQTYSRSNAYLVDFGSIAGINPDATVSSFTIRETSGHTLVKAFDAGTTVPEPSGVALLLFAYGFMAMFRRRTR